MNIVKSFAELLYAFSPHSWYTGTDRFTVIGLCPFTQHLDSDVALYPSHDPGQDLLNPSCWSEVIIRFLDLHTVELALASTDALGNLVELEPSGPVAPERLELCMCRYRRWMDGPAPVLLGECLPEIISALSCARVIDGKKLISNLVVLRNGI